MSSEGLLRNGEKEKKNIVIVDGGLLTEVLFEWFVLSLSPQFYMKPTDTVAQS